MKTLESGFKSACACLEIGQSTIKQSFSEILPQASTFCQLFIF